MGVFDEPIGCQHADRQDRIMPRLHAEQRRHQTAQRAGKGKAYGTIVRLGTTSRAVSTKIRKTNARMIRLRESERNGMRG